MGTQAIDWIMSWCTLTASARRASSRALMVTTGSPVSTTRSATEREKRACGSSSPGADARGVRLELAPLAHEHDEPALGAEQRDGVVGHALEQARDVVLGRQLARDLEDAREAVLGQARARRRCEVLPLVTARRDERGRAPCIDGAHRRGRRPSPCGPGGARAGAGRPRRPRADRAAASPPSPRASRGRPRCRAAPSPRCPAPRRGARARRAPATPTRGGRPCARGRSRRRARAARRPRRRPRGRSRRARAPRAPRARRARPRPGPARDGLELARERRGVGAGLAGAREQPLEARLGGVVRPALGLPRLRRLLVELRAALRGRPCVPRARPRGPGAARAPPARARRAARELVDRPARPRPAPEVEVEVGEVEERLRDRRAAARAAPHVDRGLEVDERLREVALGLGDAREVQARRATVAASRARSAAASEAS